MNKEQILAIIQGGHTTDGDLADALLAELAKVQEPVAYYSAHRLIPDGTTEFYGYTETKLQPGTPLYLQPLPQPDLVAEIERIKTIADNYYAIAYERSQQLSAAQASEDELLNALETLACLGNGNCYGNSHGNAIAQKAITTHKTRKEGK